MKLEARVSKIESLRAKGERMSSDEIDQAVGEYRLQLAGTDPAYSAGTISVDGFRALIAGTASPSFQRTFAAFTPLDFLV